MVEIILILFVFLNYLLLPVDVFIIQRNSKLSYFETAMHIQHRSSIQ